MRFSDPDEVVVGYDALDAKAQKILDDAPDFVFRAGGPIYINNDLGYLPGNSVPRAARRW